MRSLWIGLMLLGYGLTSIAPAQAQQNLDTTLANGNMGIGTTTPVNSLDVSGGVAIGTGYAGSKTAPTGGLIVQGNVGIGTNAPGALLHSYGTTEQLRLGYDATHYASFTEISNGDLQLKGVGGTSFYVGNYSPNPTLYLPAGSGGYVGVYTNAPGSRLSVNGNMAIGTAYAGTAAPIDGLIVSGLVGIGTASPQATLDVKGYARLTLQSSAPATCSTGNQGAIALNHLGQICICNGSAWNFDSSGNSCSW